MTLTFIATIVALVALVVVLFGWCAVVLAGRADDDAERR